MNARSGRIVLLPLAMAVAVGCLAATRSALAVPAGYVETTIPLDAPPVGLAFSPAGVLYAMEGAEFGSNEATLRTILSNGSFGPSVPVDNGDDETNFFVGAIAYDPVTDRVLITDNTGDGFLYAVDDSGDRETIAGPILGIAGVAVRSSGEIFVSTAPSSGGEVRVVDRTTGGSSPVLGGLGFGAGLAFDGGDLLVQDAAATAPYDGRVQRLPISESASGLMYGVPDTLVDGTQAAAGVAVDVDGDVFITGSGGLFVLEGSPLDDVSFSANDNPFQFSTAISFDPGDHPFEPFTGPDGGRLAFMADFGFLMEDSFITIITPAAPEDFNSDGAVDGGDLGVWAANYGSPAAEPQEGDADADGNVDGHDFLRWQRALAMPASLAVGVGAGAGASNAVPEPPASVVFLLAAAPFAWQTRKRR